MKKRNYPKHQKYTRRTVAWEKTCALAITIAVKEIIALSGACSINQLCDWLDRAKGTIFHWMKIARRYGYVIWDAEKSSTIRLTQAGQEIAKTLVLIRSGEQIQVFERVEL